MSEQDREITQSEENESRKSDSITVFNPIDMSEEEIKGGRFISPIMTDF